LSVIAVLLHYVEQHPKSIHTAHNVGYIDIMRDKLRTNKDPSQEGINMLVHKDTRRTPQRSLSFDVADFKSDTPESEGFGRETFLSVKKSFYLSENPQKLSVPWSATSAEQQRE
jgi:hypothetical protein